METVHVFISTGRFRSLAEMREYIDVAYDEDDEDGEGEDSAFMTEVGLEEYEPGLIEAVPSASGRPVPLSELLAAASYADQWLPQLDGTRLADAAVCVYPPNVVADPAGCSLEYLGAFEYQPPG